MPVDFDLDEEEGGQPSQDALTVEDDQLTPAAAQQIANALAAPAAAPKEDELDMSYLEDVDKRLEVSHYYRMLLKNSIFEDRVEAAVIVEKELRAFIRERLSSLLNLKGTGPASEKKESEVQFTDEEIKILKLWAQALSKKPGLVETVSQPGKKTPTVRKQTSTGGIRTVAATKPATPAPAATPPAPAPTAPAPAAAPTGRRLRRANMVPLLNEDGVPLYDKATGKPLMKNVTPQVRGSRAISMPADLTAATALKAQEAVLSSPSAELGAAIASSAITITSLGERKE